ncbi:ISL3 family transposase [Desulfosporosinus hippei]|uniref:Zinc-finger of transposase IS204/IS1001/IS1096/IS1165 n=1 Tax=Desulfosporosinus hippei DSM 8344 TaxID=1121419 RepID=A0A1G8M4Y7_9FIRM|nr:ISL3 family transposase [Desulfosporosinus hippei]SDI63002.1 zinc-finger of transposase IS204/IS1001/IS1096/IS1165 [Desulfosporosinus hippei DSM 8344]
MNDTDALFLSSFYPKEVKITQVLENSNGIIIFIKSLTHSHVCPKCGQTTKSYHSTYRRRIQDLPILGKSVYLNVSAYRYNCENKSCEQKVFSEELSGFTGKYRRMTSRLEDFIITLALNTSCEGTARICKQMNIKISGDTVIKILLRNAALLDPKCGEFIGVDDWAYKKGHTYGTIICDGVSHKPVALLDGRDGSALKDWLKKNQHVKIITRDRASSYAKAIMEALPEVMQIADRFHLHQNLFKAIKEALGREVPAKIIISTGDSSPDTSDLPTEHSDSKKNGVNRS